MWLVYLAIILVFVILITVLISVINRSYQMREIISEYESIQQSYGNVFSNLENFIEHLNRVKLIEHYFGDVEIQSLFEHTQFIAGQMVDAEKHYQDFMEKRNDNANTDQANIKSEPIKSSDKKRKGKKARNSSQH